ncbi:response regulator [Tessaracoccus caeni]|uniref:response regulator n=1 Tax=Tessaracoccus caeni TaxID=3031239 RepID=UPI0023DCB5D9|nr:response regulator transcription factor [Tessaracoccus caeni]MDF1486755.1 response regulator transcription factor [Tessaracoccus caeni]
MIRILLVDDDTLLRESLSLLLGAEDDIEVVGVVADGQTAIDAVHRLRPDIVVMDVRMPGVDGPTAVRRILASMGEEAPAILMVTMFDTDVHVYESLRAGASGFLLKDAPPQELVDAIRALRKGEIPMSPAVTRRLMAHYVDTAGPAEQGRSRALDGLSPREREVLTLIGRGRSNKEIQEELFISQATVKTHVSALLHKSGARDRAGLVVLAYESGLVRP